MKKIKQIHLQNLKSKFIRIKNEINKSIEYLDELTLLENEFDNRCINCGWRNIRVRIDKTYFCRSCGYDSKLNKLKEKKDE